MITSHGQMLEQDLTIHVKALTLNKQKLSRVITCSAFFLLNLRLYLMAGVAR